MEINDHENENGVDFEIKRLYELPKTEKHQSPSNNNELTEINENYFRNIVVEISPNVEEVPLKSEVESSIAHASVKEQSTVRKIRCTQCSEYIKQTDFKNHISTFHTEQEFDFVCNDCGKGYNFESGLILHKAKYHGGKLPIKGSNAAKRRRQSTEVGPVLPCELCQKEFLHITSLTVHLVKHEVHRVFECDVCDQPFPSQQSLQNHLQVFENSNQCHVCFKVCSRPALYREHVRTHADEAKYKCEKCSKAFHQPTHLAVHSVTHVSKYVYKCRACNKKFSSQSDKDKHEVGHVEERGPRRCQVCGTHLATKSLLKDHINMVHRRKQGYSCNVCGEKFYKLKNLQNHHLEHAEKKDNVCSYCGEHFDLRSSLLKHVKVHINDTIYKCVACPDQFHELNSLEEHIKGHTGKCLDCCVCGRQLADSKAVFEHYWRHTADNVSAVDDDKTKSRSNEGVGEKTGDEKSKDRAEVKCNICDKTFHFVSSLQSHSRIHKTDQSLKCHICGETWIGIKVLREHIKTHRLEIDAGAKHSQMPTNNTEENPAEGHQNKTNPQQKQKEVQDKMKYVPGGDKRNRHRCDICLEKFKSYYSCKTHRLLHIGEKPFRCDVCGLSFVLAGSLKMHALSHTKSRPHVCEICGKSFKQAYILREHQMSHTGKKPFLCDLCGKSFVNRKKLDLHVFVHTRETPFNCKVCGRGFRSFVTRQKHKCEGPSIVTGLSEGGKDSRPKTMDVHQTDDEES